MIKEYSIGNGRNVSVFYPEVIEENEKGVAQVSREIIEKCFIPLLRESEEYKWHDLRKNPNDLPENGSSVLTCENGIYQELKYYDGFNCHLIGDEIYRKNELKVTAWKYIEPFEEV